MDAKNPPIEVLNGCHHSQPTQNCPADTPTTKGKNRPCFVAVQRNNEQPYSWMIPKKGVNFYLNSHLLYKKI